VTWCFLKHRDNFIFYLMYGRFPFLHAVHTFGYCLTSGYLIFLTQFVQAPPEVKVTLLLILPTSIVTNIVFITAGCHLLQREVFCGYLKRILVSNKIWFTIQIFNSRSIVSCLLFSSKPITSFNSHLQDIYIQKEAAQIKSLLLLLFRRHQFLLKNLKKQFGFEFTTLVTTNSIIFLDMAMCTRLHGMTFLTAPSLTFTAVKTSDCRPEKHQLHSYKTTHCYSPGCYFH
jgi:hypothetical protein